MKPPLNKALHPTSGTVALAPKFRIYSAPLVGEFCGGRMRRAFFVCLLLLLFARPAIAEVWGHRIPPKPYSDLTLHKDAEFAFYGRGYGRDGEAREPALIVHDVQQDRWVILEKISTEGAKFGYIPLNEEKFIFCAAPWDFRPLAKQETVELPLGKGSFLHFPDEVQDQGDVYLLLHNTDWKDDRVSTTLRIEKQALRKLFE